MGVVHKLTKDVLDFIVFCKQENPKVSCRALSQLTSEKFQITVSKSSINAVLKSISLSSPIGRPEVQSSTKVFKIPEERKKNLFQKTPIEIIKPVNLSPKIVEKNVKLSSSILGSQQQPQTVKEIKSEVIRIEKQSDNENLPLIIDPINVKSETLLTESKSDDYVVSGDDEMLRNIHQIRRELAREKSVSNSLIGGGLLKAVFSDYFQQFSLVGLLNKYLSNPLPSDFEDLCGIEFSQYCAKELGVKEELFLDSNFWEKKLDTSGRLNTIRSVSLPPLFVLEYNLLKQQSLRTISSFKITLRDQSEILVDPLFGFAWDDRLRFERPIVLNKAIYMASRFLIGNVEPIIFNFSQSIFDTPKAFVDLVSCFCNDQEKTIKRVFVIGEDGNQAAAFDIIPKKNRAFLIGMSARQKEFSELTKNAKWAKKEMFYHEATDQLFGFTDTRTNYFQNLILNQQQFRVITLFSEDKKSEIFCIVTNVENIDASQLINKFLNHWPDLYNASAFMLADRKSSNTQYDLGRVFTAEENIFLGDVLDDYFQSAIEYFYKFYMPKTKTEPAIILKDVCALSVAVFKTSVKTMLCLKDLNSFAWQDELIFLAQRINENAFLCGVDRKFYIKTSA